jgi:hypothetical protein
MQTYIVTMWLVNGNQEKTAKFKISITPDEDLSEAAISQMPDWIPDEGWEIEDSNYALIS